MIEKTNQHPTVVCQVSQTFHCPYTHTVEYQSEFSTLTSGMPSRIMETTAAYLPHGLGFLCSLRVLSKKLLAVLIVTGEGGAETIADNNSKTIQYIFSARGII